MEMDRKVYHPSVMFIAILKLSIVVLLIGTVSSSSPSDCCKEGRKASYVLNGHSSCLNKLLPFSNPTKLCSSLFRVCCWASERVGACQNGIKYFRMFDKDPGFSCGKSPSKNSLHGSTFLECCECCQMGKFAAMNNQTCSRNSLPVNQTCGQAYQSCCEAYLQAKNRPMNCAEADCHHNCQQTSKGPVCSCRNGFKLANNSKSCQDIDECALGKHRCLAGFVCKNLIGTYRCNREVVTRKCRKGYRFESGICRDIDECASGIARCARGTVCENVLGNYLCTQKSLRPTCRPGYRPLGVRCVDIDECASGTGRCKRDGEVCRNTLGSFRCICKRGYSMKNRRCRDRDECKLYGSRICGHVCKNLPGSFRCECRDGFRLARNDRTCIDINECRKKNVCRIGETCFNLPGSHRCIQTACQRYYEKKSARSCKLNCTLGFDCKSMPVSVKWFAVSRRGPIKKFGFRMIYEVGVSKLRNVRKVSFKFEKGNEKNTFALQKYGFSRNLQVPRSLVVTSRLWTPSQQENKKFASSGSEVKVQLGSFGDQIDKNRM
eukprot:gene6909-7687_t